MELRKESVPSCPACAGEGDRIHLTSVWELMAHHHRGLEQLGCCCCPGAEGCDSQVDVFSEAGPRSETESKLVTLMST